MIYRAHERFSKWAAYVLEPVPGENLGYGKNILLEIMEGKGVILPKAPPGSGRKKISVSETASEVDAYVKGLGRTDRLLVRTFYLNPMESVERRAQRCGMNRRTMYNQIERIHVEYLRVLEGK